MTGPDLTVDTAVDPEHHALLGLHATAGAFGGAHPDPGNEKGFGPGATGEALATIAAAPAEQVSYGARLDLLHALATADFPDYEKHADRYRDLARSIGEPHDLEADTVLDDVKSAARGDQPFADTATGRTLPHEAVAFVGQEICNTAKVMVGGLPATWIFSEFETDAPFETLAGWVDPRGWPKRSPLLFKAMDLVGEEVTPLGGVEAADHWHGEFLEVVQLVDRLRTLLHCDYFSATGTAVGMTYDLTFSVANQINVDRGFLLASHVGDGVYRAKALKIVGFDTQSWDTVARFVCPLWTEFVRQAAKGGTTTTPLPPTKVPGSETDQGPVLPTDVLDQWVDFFGDAAKTYAHLVTDVANRALSGKYRIRDATTDTAKYWSQLARDWATAWSYGLDLIEDLASGQRDVTTVRPPPGTDEPGGAAAATPTAAGGQPVPASTRGAAPATDAAPAPSAGFETTTIPMPRLAPTAAVSCSDLVCIEAGSATIPAADVTVTRTVLAGGVPAVTIAVGATDLRAGLYVGTLSISGGGSMPVQLYVSGAIEGPG